MLHDSSILRIKKQMKLYLKKLEAEEWSAQNTQTNIFVLKNMLQDLRELQFADCLLIESATHGASSTIYFVVYDKLADPFYHVQLKLFLYRNDGIPYQISLFFICVCIIFFKKKKKAIGLNGIMCIDPYRRCLLNEKLQTLVETELKQKAEEGNASFAVEHVCEYDTHDKALRWWPRNEVKWNKYLYDFMTFYDNAWIIRQNRITEFIVLALEIFDYMYFCQSLFSLPAISLSSYALFFQFNPNLCFILFSILFTIYSAKLNCQNRYCRFNSANMILETVFKDIYISQSMIVKFCIGSKLFVNEDHQITICN
ncbi:hypothetical protein RFI_02631 [Reticulomyxa filosa]|uniref:Uncharacterized protein n=1 Tax=Reticulomyxa filosa TaxID=46433 RepID=X6P8M5_RETFI|nr:hypothetical protein RFI_02631 [Reticulomyxa filosa]|eukprot:ETO34463.1 hypothetical protein RFI_02631 [Reticulomyxa filosa]